MSDDFESSQDHSVIRHGSAPRGSVKLDEVDRRIVRLLRRDGRMSYAEVARHVGVSEPTVRKRVQRLVRSGAIFVVARINPAPIGFPIDAVIGIRVARGQVLEVGHKLAAMECVAYVGYLTGSYDLMIEAFLPDTEGLFRFLNDELENLDGILATETWHVLRTEKFNYMWEGEDVGRVPVGDLGEAGDTDA
ncbi:MAG: Lrp/AsnC family transcriptional regulator [Thermoleophilia bacterium]